MKKKITHPPTLLLTATVLLVILYILHILASHFIDQVDIIQNPSPQSPILGSIILLCSNLSLILFLLVLAYILTSRLFKVPNLLHKPLAFLIKNPNIRRALHFQEEPRHSLILTFVLCISFYAILFPPSTPSLLILSLLPLLLLYCITFKHNPHNAILCLFSLLLIQFFFMLKLSSLQNYKLLNSFQLGIITFALTILCTALILIRYRKQLWRNKDIFENNILPFLALHSVFLIFYFNTLLSTINCHYAPRETVQLTANVQQKCGNNDLQVQYFKNEKEVITIINVQPKLYKQVQEGKSIQIRLHQGLFGWLWYHDHINQRYYD